MDYTGTLPQIGYIGFTTGTPRGGNRTHDGGMPRFANIEDVVETLRPTQPVHCLHPEAFADNAALFLRHFPGTTFYAVKVNPDPYVLRCLYAAGIRHFDVASLPEVRLVCDLFPDAHLAFMHAVKSREAIRTAYFDYGVREFAVDTFEELHKILEETRTAADLGIHVRLALPKGSALHDLSAKFGAPAEAAASLLRDADKVAHRVGLCFHVGSQSLSPQSFVDALALVGKVVRDSGVMLDVLDVGGGFPAFYPGMEVAPLSDYFDAIRQAVAALALPAVCQLWGEPGRAMVASGGTLIVRVEMRKGAMLYINDGAYGSLFDACWMKWVYPVRLVSAGRHNRKASKVLQPFGFYGPTCDSADIMPGPFMLPSDVCEGDWIAISQHGAYGASIQSRFNGFYSDLQVAVSNEAAPKCRGQKRAWHEAPQHLADHAFGLAGKQSRLKRSSSAQLGALTGSVKHGRRHRPRLRRAPHPRA